MTHPTEPTLSTRRERSPTVELMIVAGPTIITMMSYPLKQFIDAWMVGMLGPEHLAAQGNGAVAAFLPISFLFGLNSVVNTWVSQHLGAGNPKKTAAYAWNALWICLFGWAGMMLFAALVAPLFRSLGHTPSVTSMEIDYARILLIGGVFTVAARSMSYFFYGVHRPMTIMVATIIGNLVNLGLDYLLIFGKFGFPELGIHGAGYATVIGGVVEFVIPMCIFLGPAFHRAYETRLNRGLSRRRLQEILKIGWPGALQWVNELACWGIFMTVLVGQFGAAENAAGWVALRYMQLSFMPAVGLSIAVTAVVGRYIGAGDRVRAEQRAWLGMRLAIVYMGILAALFVIFREPAIRFFISDEYSPDEVTELLRVGKRVMILAATFQVFDAMAIVLMAALRGAGDTVWPGVVSAIQAWVIIVLAGWAVTQLAPQLGSIGPWITSAAYIIALGLTMVWRFRFGPWRTIELVNNAAPTPEPVDAIPAV